jgi:hypothetical protein
MLDPSHPSVIAEMKREFDQAKKSDPQLDMRTFLKEKWY